jgi:two-component system response regulator YesN
MYNTLVVDDEIWMCQGLKKVISTYEDQFAVTGVAKDGKQALSLLENEVFHLVITDIRMPEMDGIQLLQEIRSRKMDIPVVIFTGHSEFEYAKQAIHYDVVDYLLKPLEKEKLIQVLQKVKHQYFQGRQDEASDVFSDSKAHHSCGKELIHWLQKIARNEYMNDLSISEIADQAGYNPSYVSRLFKQETGKNFVHYLTGIRMEVAQKLLLETNYSVVQVAKETGYWDVKHFSKTFKREVGTSPIYFRNKRSKVEIDQEVKNRHQKVKV